MSILPRPCFWAIGDLKTGPNCFGSPASTSCPNEGFKRSAIGMTHSGSTAWPASSMKMWVKWLLPSCAETNLKCKLNFKATKYEETAKKRRLLFQRRIQNLFFAIGRCSNRSYITVSCHNNTSLHARDTVMTLLLYFSLKGGHEKPAIPRIPYAKDR